MLCAVEAPSRCILRADDASMRHNSYRFEKRDETSKTKSERILHLGSGLAAVHEGAKAACVSPEKVASLILRCHSAPPRTIILQLDASISGCERDLFTRDVAKLRPANASCAIPVAQ